MDTLLLAYVALFASSLNYSQSVKQLMLRPKRVQSTQHLVHEAINVVGFCKALRWAGKVLVVRVKITACM